jgi:hypothetical protein
MTIHPFGDRQSALQPHKLDANAHFVLNFGGFVGYERFVWEDLLSIKLMQGIFTDCSGGLAGFTHLGFRAFAFEKKRFKVMFGMGPTLYYRDDWNRFPGYIDTGFFHRISTHTLGPLQYYLFVYGMEFEFDYRLNKRIDLNGGFTPGAPLALTFSAGIKYWICTDFKRSEKFVIPK